MADEHVEAGTDDAAAERADGGNGGTGSDKGAGGGDGASSFARHLKEIGAMLASLVAVFGVVGISGSAIARVVRNEPGWFVSGLAGVAVAALFLAVALVFEKSSRRMFTVAAVVLVYALVVVGWSAYRATVTKDHPEVAVTMENQDNGLVRVTATVTATGMRSRDVMHIRVDGRSEYLRNSLSGVLEAADGEEFGPRRTLVTLYKASVGGDESGEVDHALQLDVNPGQYASLVVRASSRDELLEDPEVEDERSCDADAISVTEDGEQRRDPGSCVEALLPQGSQRPNLLTAIQPATGGSPPMLSVSLASVGHLEVEGIALEVFVRAGDEWHRHYRNTLSPDGNGRMAGDVEMPLVADAEEVCAVATHLDELHLADGSLVDFVPFAGDADRCSHPHELARGQLVALQSVPPMATTTVPSTTVVPTTVPPTSVPPPTSAPPPTTLTTTTMVGDD